MEQVRFMVFSLWAMLSHLMGMTKSDSKGVNTAEYVIRVFLTAMSDHNSSTREVTGRKLPIWLSQYNFQCLLNMPEQIRMLGPIRNRWEGGVRGEGFIRVVKPITQSRRMHWQRNLLTNILRQKTLLVMKHKEVEDLLVEEEEEVPEEEASSSDDETTV